MTLISEWNKSVSDDAHEQDARRIFPRLLLIREIRVIRGSMD